MTPQEKLKALRKERKLTTYKLAELCGLPQSTISKLENGRRRIDSDVLYKITKVLNVSISEIFEPEEVKFKEKVGSKEEVEDKKRVEDKKGIESKREIECKREVDNNKEVEDKKRGQAPPGEEKLQQTSGNEKVDAIAPGDITRDFNNIMSKFYSNEGGPLFYNGVELEGENMELFEEAIKLAIRTVKMKKR